jgi:tRNA-binding EMAP/Myf-like protein
LKEKPMAEAAAGGGGSGAADSGGGEKKPKADPRKKEVAPVADSGAEVGDVVDISWADIRVGKIVDAVPHPESDKLYVETIDLGDESPRQILSASDNLPEYADCLPHQVMGVRARSSLGSPITCRSTRSRARWSSASATSRRASSVAWSRMGWSSARVLRISRS